jgi:hypothetical protein
MNRQKTFSAGPRDERVDDMFEEVFCAGPCDARIVGLLRFLRGLYRDAKCEI